MGFCVKHIDENYDFIIEGVSYIGNPLDSTAMYVSKKVQHLVENLREHKNCLVYAEFGIEVDQDLKDRNCFVFCDSPQYAYALFATEHAKSFKTHCSNEHFKLSDGGYYLGSNVTIGKNVYIEPGVTIGPNVAIGDDAVILAGAVIKNAIIGNKFICNENAVIGSNGFTFTTDDNGNSYRIPTLGNVIIGDSVEIGVNDNISAGVCGSTVIDDYAKIDALVHVGHEAHIHKNVEIVAGTVVGGFACIGEGAFLGINASVRNRITIGKGTTIGMSAVVTKSVGQDEVMVGNPARRMEK